MTFVRKEVNGAMEIILKEMIAKIEGDNLMPWQRGYDVNGQSEPINMVSGKAYNTINTMILKSQGASAYWLSYSAIKKLNGEILEDVKSKVFQKYFKAKKVKGKVQLDGNGKPVGNWVRRFVYVYNVTQTNLEAPTKKIVNDFNPIESAEAVISGYKDAPKMIHHVDSDKAFYRPSTHTVTMPAKEKFKTEAGYYTTMFHELVHSTGKELKRDMTCDFGSEKYSYEELVAEMGASMLTMHCGIDSSKEFDNSAAYVKGWLKYLTDNKKCLFDAAADADKAVKRILG